MCWFYSHMYLPSFRWSVLECGDTELWSARLELRGTMACKPHVTEAITALHLTLSCEWVWSSRWSAITSPPVVFLFLSIDLPRPVTSASLLIHHLQACCCMNQDSSATKWMTTSWTTNVWFPACWCQSSPPRPCRLWDLPRLQAGE
jgi:hypothetical protein